MRPTRLTQSSETTREVVDNDWASPGLVHALVLMAATGIGIYLCYRVASPFLSAFAWALALAVLFTPLQVRLEKKLKWPSVAASLSVVVIGLIVVIPLTFAVQRLVVQVAQGAKLIESNVQTGEWRQILENQPYLQPQAVLHHSAESLVQSRHGRLPRSCYRTRTATGRRGCAP